MYRITAYALASSVIALAIVSVGTGQNTEAAPAKVDLTAAKIFGKGDRLERQRTAVARESVALVEVVGPEGAAIVYRDRQGRVLFADEPASSTTVIAKNVMLPSAKKASDRPNEAPTGGRTIDRGDKADEGRGEAQRERMIACESALGPLAKGADARRPDLCLAARSVPMRVAALSR